MKNTVLKKPTMFHLIKGMLISMIQALFMKSVMSLPKMVGKYQLVNTIRKESAFDREHAIGVYKNGDKKVFIKTWTGKMKDFGYYSLINEYFMTRNFNKKSRIKTPRIISYTAGKNSLSIIFEYVDGLTLNKYPLSKQAEIISEVLNYLHKISGKLTVEEKKQFPVRSKTFYVISLFFFSMLSLLSNIKSWKIIIKATYGGIKNLSLLNSFVTSLAHRDLDIDNILVNKSGIYLLDCGRMVMTIPEYDISHMSLDPKLRKLTEIIIKKINKFPNEFLKTYILIQNAKSYGNPKKFNNYYLKGLYEKYE